MHEVTLPVQMVQDLHWMARRYADWRSTYAPGTVNEITRYLLSKGVPLNKYDGTLWARDGMWPLCAAGLTPEEHNESPPDNEGQTWQNKIHEAVEFHTKVKDAEIERLKRLNDPELDATDFAHPAWWRGYDNGVAASKQKIENLQAKNQKFLEALNLALDLIGRTLGGECQPGNYGYKDLQQGYDKISDTLSQV